jgi:hypothetical protein
MPADQQSSHHNIFDATQSQSYQSLEGNNWENDFGDGKYISGSVGIDTVQVGEITVANQAVQ